MSCLSTRVVLDLFSEDLLTPSRRAAVARHLQGCAACRAAADGLRAPKAAAVSAPAALKDRLRRAMAAPHPSGATAPLPLRGADGRGAAFALLLFALSLAVLHAVTPEVGAERAVTTQAGPWVLQ